MRGCSLLQQFLRRMVHASLPGGSDASGPGFRLQAQAGRLLFIVYALIYAGFVAINLIRPVLMEKTVLGGLNLAVVYGMGLIILALLMALVYNRACDGGKRRLHGQRKGRP